MIDRQRIIAEAVTWLRTPWQHNQAVKGAGVDCARFIRAVFVACGIIQPFRVAPYAEQWALHRSEEKFLATLRAFGRQVPEPLPGDVVVIKFGRCYAHGGIVIAWPRIIHAFKPERAVVYTDIDDCPALANRPRQFFEVG